MEFIAEYHGSIAEYHGIIARYARTDSERYNRS